MSTEYDVQDVQFYEDARGGRTVVPESYYPVAIGVENYEASAQAGTPGLRLFLAITEGPFAGCEISGPDATVWLTPGKTDAKRPGQNLGKVNHMTHMVTGKYPDAAALKRYGVVLTDPSNARQVMTDICFWFSNQDADTKTAFMKEYARVAEWDGKHAVAFVQLEEENRQELNTDTGEWENVLDEQGNPQKFFRNRIGNFFGVNDPKYGLASLRKMHFPQQQAAYDKMNETP